MEVAEDVSRNICEKLPGTQKEQAGKKRLTTEKRKRGGFARGGKFVHPVSAGGGRSSCHVNACC